MICDAILNTIYALQYGIVKVSLYTQGRSEGSRHLIVLGAVDISMEVHDVANLDVRNNAVDR